MCGVLWRLGGAEFRGCFRLGRSDGGAHVVHCIVVVELGEPETVQWVNQVSVMCSSGCVFICVYVCVCVCVCVCVQ